MNSTTWLQFPRRRGRQGLAGLLTLVLTGCATETPTRAVIVNGYPVLAEGDPAASGIVVYRAWYATTLFREPVAPGAESEAQRMVPGSDEAYAVLAPGWDPASGAVPKTFVPVRSRGELPVARGDELRIVISDSTFAGRCNGSTPLTQAEADFITTRIFPGEFDGVRYDAATCAALEIPMPDAADQLEHDTTRDAASGGSDATSANR